MITAGQTLAFTLVGRYAEKDHQQLMDLCHRRDALKQKLSKRDHREMDVDV